MRTKHVVLAVAIVLAAFSPLRAELPAPLIEVKDTLCQMNSGIGNAKGAVFMPDGKTIIGIMDDTPMVFDAVTGKEIRRLDSIPKKNVEPPQISKDGRYLIANSSNGLAVWDIPSGKIIKYLRICADYCLSPDGTKLYEAYMNENNKGVIRVYDMNTLEEIEVFCNHGFTSARDIACSPDGSTLAVSVYHQSNDDKINSVILIDLKNKTEYTEIQNLVPLAQNLQFSPDGKYLMYVYSNSNNSKDIYIQLYDIESKGKKIISEEDIRNLFEYKTSIGFSYFYDNQTISINYSSYVLIWNITENKLKKIIDFYAPYHDINNNKLLLCDYQGNLAVLDLDYVSIDELQPLNNLFLKYTNNQLEFISDKAFLGEVQVFDTAGKSIINLGIHNFLIGNNILQINIPLPLGVYILTIKNGSDQISKKFLVE